MPLLIPPPPAVRKVRSIANGTRPTQVGAGTSVTPATDAWGSWAEVFAAAAWPAEANDACGILIRVTDAGLGSATRGVLVSIGVDTAGGSSYTPIVTSDDGTTESGLYCANGEANASGSGGAGFEWYFPLAIARGSSIAARAAVSGAVLDAMRVEVTLCYAPSGPVRVCRFIHAFGVDTATSSGTTVVPGTASDGAWTQIGAGAVGRSYWGCEFSLSVEDPTMANNATDVEVTAGDAANKRPSFVLDHMVRNTSTEFVLKQQAFTPCEVVAGDLLYMRAQTGPNALDTRYAGAVYLIGG